MLFDNTPIETAGLQFITSAVIVLMHGIKPKEPVVETFSSFSNDSVNDQGLDVAFYKEFIKEDLFQSAQITHALVKETEGGKSTKPFAVYVVLVSTAHIQYSVERRYSCYRRQYKKQIKKVPLKSEFPSKTFLSSSTNEDVMNRRKARLSSTLFIYSELISEIMALENKQYLIDLLDFLEIKTRYTHEKIMLPSDKQQTHRTDEEYIFDLLDRLSHQADSIAVFYDIQKAIFEQRIRVTSEAIRQLFVGLGNRKGLLKFCLVNDNQGLVCLKALQLINRLLNFQQNRDAEAYVRTFVGCPPKALKILPELLLSCQVKLSYFQLLDTYFKRNCQLNTEELLDFLFIDSIQEKQDFILWSKIRCSSNLNVELYEQKLALSHAAEIDEKVSWLLNQIELDNRAEKTLFETIGKHFSFNVQDCREGIVKFTFLSNQDEEIIKQMFTASMKWNSKVTFSKTDPYAKTLTVHMDTKQPMRFKFSLETRKLGNGPITIRKPISSSSCDFPDTFYQIVKVSSQEGNQFPMKVEIWEYYESPLVKEYLQNELVKGTQILNSKLTMENQ